MDYSKKWETVETLGQGGQGKVYLVSKKCESASYPAIRKALGAMTAGVVYDGTQDRAREDFIRCLRDVIRMYDPAEQGALKVLHKPEDARNPDLAKDRIRHEIEVMSENIHPSLLKVLDVDTDFEWYVSKYYANGTLADRKDLFRGDLGGTIRALRPIVQGVAELHKRGYVHRDIKPHNVFIDKDNKLALGDFGLIYFMDNEHTRVSATYENVGSRDWMPAWAMGMRIDQVRPTFDVFSLGKLLWAMVSGREILQLWYYDRDQFNVEVMFPKSPNMRFANQLFKKCIVEEEKDCLPDADAFLNEIDKILSMLQYGTDPTPSEAGRPCRVCGVGKYDLEVDDGRDGLRNFFGATSPGMRHWRILACSHCGNLQLFSYADKVPEGWHKK
jgi:serine/threonine protein kinase